MRKAKHSLPQPVQTALFGRFQSMSLMDMWKECGRIRRAVYGRQMAEEKQRQAELPADKKPTEGLE